MSYAKGTKPPVMSITFTARMPLGLMEAIKQDIEESGDYNSIAQWINAACREYLAKRRRDYPRGDETKVDKPEQ